MKRVLGLSILLLGLSACATSGEKKQKVSDEELSGLYVELALASIQEGDPISALKSLEEAERLDSKSAKVAYTRSIAFLARKDNDKALHFAKLAHDRDPKNSEYMNTLGKLYFDAGRFQEAEPLLLQASQDPLYRGAFKSLTVLGMLNLKKGDESKALVFFDKAIDESASGACVAYYYRGNIRMNRAQFEGAVRDYEKAIRGVCANFPEAHFAIGVAYSRSAKYDLARKKFLEVKELYPDTALANQAIERLRYLP